MPGRSLRVVSGKASRSARPGTTRPPAPKREFGSTDRKGFQRVCTTIYLLADRRLPAPPDETAYPGLTLYPMEADDHAEVLADIRRIAPAAFAYAVRPKGYCGCYFSHETPEVFAEQMAGREAHPSVEYADTPEHAEAMWRCRNSALK